MDRLLDKAGTAGMLITAAFSPCCFPLFAFVASTLGLGTVELFGGWTMWLFLGLSLLSLIGLYLSYRQHKCTYPLIAGVPSVILIFYGYFIFSGENWLYFLYAGMTGLMVATGINYYRNKLHDCSDQCGPSLKTTVELHSTITCPLCGHKELEIMPTDACVYFYDCKNCKEVLKPLKGDCCVYCSYGTVKCPPMQGGTGCC